VIEFKEEQDINKESDKDVTFSGIVIDFNDEQPTNTSEPILETLDGRLIVVKLEQPLNAYVLILVIFVSVKMKVVMLDNPAKALLPILLNPLIITVVILSCNVSHGILVSE